MNKIKIFIELTRLNKPIGFMLLFWPCLWGLTLALNQTKEFGQFVKYIILFFVGSVLMAVLAVYLMISLIRILTKK